MMWPEQFETEANLVAALWAGQKKGKGRMLQGNKSVALGGARGYIFRQISATITLSLKARRKTNVHWWRSLCTSDSISLCCRIIELSNHRTV